MNKKIVKTYCYDGLGFPIILTNVELIKFDDEWHPKIDVKRIATIVIKKLASQNERLTGNQIKFIRSYFAMTLREFAKEVVNESHTAVSKWEKFGDDETNMDINIEKILRLYIFEKISANTKKQQQTFFEKYKKLKNISSSKGKQKCLEICVAS